jgi:magnesium transporter
MRKIGQREINQPVSEHVRHGYTTLFAAQTIRQALQWLRTQKLGEQIVYFYVVNDDGKLVGVVPTRKLLIEEPDTSIESIMITNVVSIPAKMTVLEACEFFVMYRLLAFPVVDEENRLLGVIDVGLFTDEMLTFGEQRSSEHLFQLIGVQMESLRPNSPLSGFRRRFPWILCNVVGGLCCAFITARYEQFLGDQIILALFIPIVLTLAEGVSMQSMTIALQNIREGGIAWRPILVSLRTELLTAIMLGISCGFIVAFVANAWKGHPHAAFAIGASIAAAITTASLLGILLPVIVRMLRGDPRIAAGPVVLACADVATLLFYFNLAGWILK